jgi:NADH-quinone oxidoreductase subunit N
MDVSNIIESLKLLKPEIAISAGLLIVLIFDLIFHKDKKLIPYVALLGLFAAGYFVIQQFGMSGFGFATKSSFKAFGMVTVDSFGTFFKLLILIAAALIVCFSSFSNEIKKTADRLGEYYVLIFGMILGMFLMASATDLILVYLSMEMLSLSSYVLAGFTKLRDRNSEAALKYLVYGAVSSGIMLFGISLIYGLTGSTNLYIVNSLIQGPQINVLTLSFAIVLIIVGMGFKISAAPFHFWTPDVYEGAPIAITAFLSVASKAAGFALLIRFVKTTFAATTLGNGYWMMNPTFDWKAVLVIMSVLTMTLGNFTALWQNNLKRMLAYSSIAHAGYMLLGLAVFSNQGIIAILIYFAFYMIMNLGAFLIVMLIANKLGSEEIDDYDGLGYTSPFLGVCLAIFLVSLTGLPPTAGFIGKLYLFSALIDAKMIAVAVIAVLNTVVGLYYYIRVLKHMYLVKVKVQPVEIIPAIGPRLLVLLLVIPVLVFGVYFTPVVELAKNCVVLLGF